MEQYDEKFERFLREFVPNPPRVLLEKREPPWARRLAAAAAVVILVGASGWFAMRRSESKEANNIANPESWKAKEKTAEQTISVVQWTKIALEQPEKLNAILTMAARNSLPPLQGSESTLRVLTKE